MQLYEFAPQAIEIIIAIIIYFSALSLLIRGAVSALTAKHRERRNKSGTKSGSKQPEGGGN
jgi:simple sugar transport system permease protein